MNECREKPGLSLGEAKSTAQPFFDRFEVIENQQPGKAWPVARMAMKPLAQLHQPESYTPAR